jgi:hypothetical protein
MSGFGVAAGRVPPADHSGADRGFWAHLQEIVYARCGLGKRC